MRLFITRSQREDARGRIAYEAQAVLSLDRQEANAVHELGADRHIVLRCENVPAHGQAPVPSEVRLGDLRRRYVFRSYDFYEIHRFEEKLREACVAMAQLLSPPGPDGQEFGAELLMLYRALGRNPGANQPPLSPMDNRRLEAWRGRPVPNELVAELEELKAMLG